MIPSISTAQIPIFLSLFKGRDDVFAIRWEKEGKSGYTPAYELNWEEFSRYKTSGGTLKDFPNKQFSRLTEQRIINHLSGKEVIGLYPLLADNSSWFVVADFDENLASKNKWTEECQVFINACQQLKIPAYLERSRSGKGGHVWIFFASNFPAFKSRKIILHILESTGIISAFDKNSNYDRVFPNQDYHTGKGLGNLIALPLQKKALENNNSCFIDPSNLAPYHEQGIFLQNIKRLSGENYEKIYASITSPEHLTTLVFNNHITNELEIQITLNCQIVIPRSQISSEVLLFLRDNLNFTNSEYLIKKRLGKNTFGTVPYFKTIEEREGFIFIPKGFIGRLLRFFQEHKIKNTFIDERKKLTIINYSLKTTLYDYQKKAIEVTEKKQMGVIVAPPGSGKTIIGLGIIASKKQPALIIVHRKQLFDQWVERIQLFLGIAEPFIGKIAPSKFKIGAHITIAMIQSLPGCDISGNIFKSFGTIIIDECHHVPAKTFREVIKGFNSFYLYGLTATPVRKNNDEKLIFIHIGDVIHETKFLSENSNASKKVAVIVRETELIIPFDYKTDKPETLYQILIHDSVRNRLIIEDIKTEANIGKKILVLTERKAHVEILYQYLKNKYEVVTISGDDSTTSKKIKYKQIHEGGFQILIATGQLIGEGADFNNLTCLILAYPFAFEGKLIQYIGRVQRNEAAPIIYDYRDINIDYLEKQFKQRNKYYKTLLNTGQIHRFDELLLIFEGTKVHINSQDCSLSINCLDISVEIETFKEGVVWKVRVLAYDEESCILNTEIINYNANQETFISKQMNLQFLLIEKICFKAIDTSQLLRAVDLKQMQASNHNLSEPVIYYENIVRAEFPKKALTEKQIIKTIKISFSEVLFQNAGVTFLFYIEELQKEIQFTIENQDIRPEFEAIKEYFFKIVKKKLITVEIKIRFRGDEILYANAYSEDIDKINTSTIDSVRFEFVKKGILRFNGKPENTSNIQTFDNIAGLENGIATKLFKSEKDLINDILSIKNSKHFLHLKYLSSHHLSTILKIRFILNPFSFLFLLAGDKKYHLIWETLDSEEATYIWHFEKSMDALRIGLNQIEIALIEIKANSKLDYLRQDHNNFSRVIHDYCNSKSGFIAWKGMLEEQLV